MSPIALTLLLLLVLMTLLLASAIGYAVHRHPALTAPLTAAGMVVALVITCVCTIAAR
ncbi:hypothetical protein ABZY57_28845 [Streptomyces sp. NPDC006450]|uniref:hypothetical protein n=1 Tax=Streptomyces sp. NPDC006450 TaxID=3155458 RepID=UPI0033A148F5